MCDLTRHDSVQGGKESHGEQGAAKRDSLSGIQRGGLEIKAGRAGQSLSLNTVRESRQVREDDKAIGMDQYKN